MGGLVQKENFLSTLQCKKAAPKSLYTSMRLTGPVGVRVPVLHGVPYEELNACYSPKQALEVLQSKPFQFEDLLFLPLSAKYSGRKVIGCSFRDENGSIGKQQYCEQLLIFFSVSKSLVFLFPLPHHYFYSIQKFSELSFFIFMALPIFFVLNPKFF